jgi:hypothetical protein
VKRLAAGTLVLLVAVAVGAAFGAVAGDAVYLTACAVLVPGSVTFSHRHVYVYGVTVGPLVGSFEGIGTVVGALGGIFLEVWLVRRLWGRTAGAR